jgi:hypothetical protein
VLVPAPLATVRSTFYYKRPFGLTVSKLIELIGLRSKLLQVLIILKISNPPMLTGSMDQLGIVDSEIALQFGVVG